MDRTHVSYLLYWQAGSLPLAPPGKAPGKGARAYSLSRVWLFATPWTVAHQAPLFGLKCRQHRAKHVLWSEQRWRRQKNPQSQNISRGVCCSTQKSAPIEWWPEIPGEPVTKLVSVIDPLDWISLKAHWEAHGQFTLAAWRNVEKICLFLHPTPSLTKAVPGAGRRGTVSRNTVQTVLQPHHHS